MVSAAEMNGLADVVAKTLDPNQAERTAAEQFLSAQQSNPQFTLALLQLSATDSLPVAVRQAAAVYLKNFVNRYYAQENWPDLPAQPRDALKNQLVSGVLLAPVVVRRQLSAVLAIIAENEYPLRWPSLVTQLNEPLNSAIKVANECLAKKEDPTPSIPWDKMQGSLESLAAIFERYPNRMRSDALFSEINVSLKCTAPSVLYLLPIISTIMGTNLAQRDPKLISIIVGNAQLLARIFYLLSWQDLPEFMEDNLKPFMEVLLKLLKFEDEAIDAAADDEPSCIDAMHAAIIEIFNLYSGKYEEEFRPYLQHFVTGVWELLIKRSNAQKYDKVVTTGIKFLTTVSRSSDHKIFEDSNVLFQVCNAIVIPNIQLREDDKELFEDNPVEYIRLDMEGSDSGTRRRGAVELVKGLCQHFESKVTEIFSSHVSKMLAPTSSWEDRDTALYIVTALGWKSGTSALGATETSSLINVVDFFNTQVLPELTKSAESPQALAAPIFTADLIKYVVSFRVQIPKTSYGNIIILASKLLDAREPVVKTYSAMCIERLLQVKDLVPNSKTRLARLSKEDMKPILVSLLPVVGRSLQSSDRADEYLMRLILRFCTVSQDNMRPYIASLIDALVKVLQVIIKNPANPLFNHYLFETLSALLRFTGDMDTIASFENVLHVPLRSILVEDVSEFVPYVFQLLSQMMNIRTDALPDVYKNYVPAILDPVMWEKRGYIPSMVQYLEVYVRKNSAAVIANKQMEPFLGVFNKLVASKATDHLGVRLLCAIFETYDAGTLANYVNAIFSVLLLRLSKAKTAKYVQCLLYALSVFVLHYGGDALKHGMDSQQNDLLAMFLEQVWLPHVASTIRPAERRICVLALAELGCKSDLCCAQPYLNLWPRIITTAVALAEGMLGDDIADEGAEEENAAHLGAGESYSAAHSQLQWGLNPKNQANKIRPGIDAKKHIALSVAQLSARHPGRFGSIIEGSVGEKAKVALLMYMQATGATIS